LSLVAAIAFFAVLCGFVLRLGSVLREVAAQLAVVRTAAGQMREYGEVISPAVDGMNQNLYGVAANLSAVGDAAEDLVGDAN
jgi:hypothetical protein